VRSGPALIRNNRGEWFVDTRLRLRGGGLSSQRKALKQQNRARITELKRQLAEFSDGREQARKELTDAHKAMKNSVGDEALLTAQTQFLEKLEQRTQDYAAPIEQMKSLNLLETVPNYRASMIEMLGTQLFFNQTWLDQRSPTFAQTLRETLALLEAEETAGVPAIAPPTRK
jgi:DNA repair exonuclease SbcCD ATPase subunit